MEILSVVSTVVKPPELGTVDPTGVPSITPPSISTASLFCTEMVPNPRTFLALGALDAVMTPTIGAVEEPVPPRETGTIPEVNSWPLNDR